MALYRGLRKIGLNLIGMIKQGDGGFPKNGLCKLLDDDNKPRGSHVTAVTEIEDEKVIAVAWKGKSDKSKKNKSKRKFWMSTFIASDCTTTLPGDPAEKKDTLQMVKKLSLYMCQGHSWFRITIMECLPLI